MCWGEPTTTNTQTNAYTANPAVSSAAKGNLSFVQGLQKTGFSPYSGNQVAPFSGQQSSSFGMADNLATGGVPYVGQAKDMIGNYAGAPGASVSANPIYSQMAPYMNQYVDMALRPQLAAQDIQFAGQNQANDAAATSSGAYGDARAGIQRANTGLMQDIARSGLIGQAYNSAFNTAIGAGAQDVSNQLSAGTTNANLYETMLNRSLGGASALEGLGTYGIGQGTNLVNVQNAAGQQQTAQSQAGLNAQYQQWLMQQQYPFMTAQLMNQTTQAGSGALGGTTTGTTQQPNNMGYGIMGALGGSVLGNSGFGSALGTAIFASDERIKEDIDEIGELHDGTPVYTFKYKFDPLKVTYMGVMAQDVEKTTPEAVVTLPSGVKGVDYEAATRPARAISRALALAA